MYRAIPYIDIRLIYFPMEIPVKNILGQLMFIGYHIGIIYCFPLRWQNFPTGSQHQVQSQAQFRSHLYDLKMQYSLCSVRQTISDSLNIITWSGIGDSCACTDSLISNNGTVTSSRSISISSSQASHRPALF